MGILTKGMGAILKKPKSRKISNLANEGKTFKIKDVTYGAKGNKITSTRYVGGPLKDFSYKPRLPKKRGQGKLFGEKFEKPKKQLKQLTLPFKGTEDAKTTIKKLTNKAEIK